jgi:F-type H+-transporting ATPase subunit b
MKINPNWYAPLALALAIALKFAFNWEVDATFVALIAFILFFGVLIYFGAPKQVGAMLDQRSQAIAKELDDARRLREQAASLLAEYEAKREAAKKHAEEIIAHAKDQAAMLAAETRAQMGETLKRRERQAEEKIARAEAQAVADVRAAAADAAVQSAEQILRAQLNPAKQAALIESGAAELTKKFV